MKSNHLWTLVDQLASAESVIGDRELQLTIASQSAAAGANITVGQDAVSLFSITSSEADPSLAELYVRGNDLIARHDSSADAFDRELYWRILNGEKNVDGETGGVTEVGSFALEMIFSLQTDLLDTRPQPCIVSTMSFGDRAKTSYWSAVGDALAGELNWQRQPNANGCQLIMGQLSGGVKVVVAVYPTDLTDMELVSSDGKDDTHAEVTVTCRLNADFLEKGVIRRTRMLAAFFESDATESAMLELGQQFLDSEIPLTT